MKKESDDAEIALTAVESVADAGGDLGTKGKTGDEISSTDALQKKSS